MPRGKLGEGLRQIADVTIHCAVCFNQNKYEPAFTVIKSYAVCEYHVQLVSQPSFDIFSIRGDAKKPGPAAT